MKTILLLIIFIFYISASLLCFFVNFILSSFFQMQALSPWRWLLILFLPGLMAFYGYRRKSVCLSGAISGLFVGILLTFTSYAFLVDLIIFFLSASRATKFGVREKMKIERDFKEGGQRNWVQVFCNGGVGCFIALIYLVNCGTLDTPISFKDYYTCSWLSIAHLGAFSCTNGDTWASELGSVLAKGDPFLITTMTKVPKGTNGAVSFIGLLMSAFGGLVVGLGRYLFIVAYFPSRTLANVPPQWHVIFMGMTGGFIGSLVDSILGATLQFSGMDKDKYIVEHPGPGVQHICGLHLMNNHAVNLASSVITAILLPYLFWNF